MNNYREVEDKRSELTELISQAERRLMMQLDPYVRSRRGLDLGEYFYDLKSQLSGRIFSEEALSSAEPSRGLNQNVEDAIRECYENVLRTVLYNVGLDEFQETKRYVIGSHSNMVQQVQDLMQEVRNIINTKATAQVTAQISYGSKLLQQAEQLIEQTDVMLVVQKANLEVLKTELTLFANKSKEDDAEKQQNGEQQKGEQQLNGEQQAREQQDGEQKDKEGKSEETQAEQKPARPLSMLERVDQLMADTDKMMATQRENLVALEKQLREYFEAHPELEAAKEPESVSPKNDQTDPFRLSDKDMESFNKGYRQAMELIDGNPQATRSQDPQTKADDLLK